jgi:hypothetical protein
MKPELVEKVAMALCRGPGSLCVGFCHVTHCKQAVEQYGTAATAAIEAMRDEVEREIADWLDGLAIMRAMRNPADLARSIRAGEHRSKT